VYAAAVGKPTLDEFAAGHASCRIVEMQAAARGRPAEFAQVDRAIAILKRG
jgi:hypothetical protein